MTASADLLRLYLELDGVWLVASWKDLGSIQGQQKPKRCRKGPQSKVRDQQEVTFESGMSRYEFRM